MVRMLKSRAIALLQTVPISAAVIVTTPQKLAFIDVAKGIRMFSKLRVRRTFTCCSGLDIE